MPRRRWPWGWMRLNFGQTTRPLCQEVGEAAHHLGREGILAPSATGTGTVLAVFVERVLPNSRLALVSTTRWDSIP